MKLISITFQNAPRIPGIRPGDLSTLDCYNPNEPMRGWRAMLRGPALFLVSPPGWRPGLSAADRDPKGPIVIHEVPRAECYMHWSGVEGDVDEIVKGKFVSPPFGPEPPPPEAKPRILDKLDPSQMGDA